MRLLCKPLHTLGKGFLDRRKRRHEAVLDLLKARYHAFRVLLDTNETALDHLKNVGMALHAPVPPWSDLAREVDSLIEGTYELTDGLNHLTGGRFQSLYSTHRRIAAAVRLAMETLAVTPHQAPRCLFFDELSPGQAGISGGKAAHLALLKRSGFPVPDGFAITTLACLEILAWNDLEGGLRRRLLRMEHGALPPGEIEVESEEIRRQILACALPDSFESELRRAFERLAPEGGVSVRSSAVVEDKVAHSFAGQFLSVLNVPSFDALKQALLEVMASPFTPGAIAYRLHAGLPLSCDDMAVVCQRMVPARSAGVLFTVNPATAEGDRMLISAVPGLGISAVSGSVPTDLYRPPRETGEAGPFSEWSEIALKTGRTVALSGGGVAEEGLPRDEAGGAVLTEAEVHGLVRCGRMIETLFGTPQDVEWAMDPEGRLWVLQSRGIRTPVTQATPPVAVRGERVAHGVCASQGRCVGRVRVVGSPSDLERCSGRDQGPWVLVLQQSLPAAAAWLDACDGVVVAGGNPADHLSCVAREYGIPMVTGAGEGATHLVDGQWVVLDADAASLFLAPDDAWASLPLARPKRTPRPAATAPTGMDHLAGLLESLHLTDAYGPTFSAQECRSLHDIIRFTHEMAVLAMFDAGDALLEHADALVRILDEGLPFHFVIIDLGGGVCGEKRRRWIKSDDLRSAPLIALWKGMATPGLRWNQPPPVAGLSGFFSRALLDGRSARPVGSNNYALITSDYLNLNARVDYHFAMVDAVCGAVSRGNHIKFRFKGGGTSAVQRERRGRFVSQVMRAHGFATEQNDDLVTAFISGMPRDETAQKLEMVGKLLGFSRLLDAAMVDDRMPEKIARAFMEGDYGLAGLSDGGKG